MKIPLVGTYQGIQLIRDNGSKWGRKSAVVLGTSTKVGAGPAQRLMPIEGEGIAMSSKGDTGGVFVAASTSRVGINHRCDTSGVQCEGNLHVKGDLTSEIIVAPGAGTGSSGAAVMLHSADSHNTVLLGKPESDKLRYAIGRGKMDQLDRAMSMKVPALADYDGAGKDPLIVYQSPNKALAAITSTSGNLFLAGNFAVKQDKYNGVDDSWKSGTKSNLHVFGEMRMEAKDATDNTALYYPSDGKAPSFSFRSGTPTQSTAVDTKVFIGGTKDRMLMGINTVKPKSHLDVRGHLYMQGDNRGSAVMYFPQGKTGGFHIRGSEDPSKNDAASTLFYISPDGKTGINTVQPAHGLCIHPKADTQEGEHLMIPKGNLHVKDGIRDLDGAHTITFDGANNFKSMNIETALTVGTAKAHEGKNALVHIQGTKMPKLLISHGLGKETALVLQTGADSWTLQGTSTDFHFISSKTTQPKIFITGGPDASEVGTFAVGNLPDYKPKYAIQIETNAPDLSDANSAYIGAVSPKGNVVGNVRVFGALIKKSMYKGQVIYWRLHPAGFSNMKDIGIDTTLAIGTDKVYTEKYRQLYIEKGRSVDLGAHGFMYTTGNQGTVSFNEYIVTSQGMQEKKLHNKKQYAAAMRFGNDGTTIFEGTAEPGVLKMTKLMTIDPAASKTTFEKFSDFGMQSASGATRFPLRVKGGTDTKKASIGFGHVTTSMGLLGSTKDFAFLGTSDEQKYLALQHADGKVGMGTTTPTDDLTIRTLKSDSDIHFTSSKTPGKVALLTMLAGGSVKLHATAGDVKSGMFEIKEYTNLHFGNAGGKAETIFDRANPPTSTQKGAAFEPPVVEFRTGKVGMGVEVPDKDLHLGGDHWSQGLMILKNGMGSFSPSTMMELTSMIETGEGSDLAKMPSPTHEVTDEIDVADTVLKLAKLVRTNRKRLLKQAATIGQMQSTMASLMA
jgi:hypothetical protein